MRSKLSYTKNNLQSKLNIFFLINEMFKSIYLSLLWKYLRKLKIKKYFIYFIDLMQNSH